MIVSIGLPNLTALPLLRYVRGRGPLVMLAILVGATALPVWSGWSTGQDPVAGPISRAAEQGSAPGQFSQELYLPYTDQGRASP